MGNGGTGVPPLWDVVNTEEATCSPSPLGVSIRSALTAGQTGHKQGTGLGKPAKSKGLLGEDMKDRAWK